MKKKSSHFSIFLGKIKYFGLRKLFYIFKSTSIFLEDMLIDLGVDRSDIAQSLIKRRISKKLIEEFSGDFGHNINTNQFFLGFGLIHYALIRNVKPKSILCIGSRMGFIPAVMALACKDNKCGHVDFVDAGYNQDNHEKHWSGIGFWKKSDSIRRFSKIGVSGFISTYVMTTLEFANAYPKKRYQYVYIDGDHSYDGVKLDYDLFWPRLERGYFMSFHDVIARGYLDKGLFGVWKFWKELSTHDKIIFSFPKDSGLGILQKQS